MENTGAKWIPEYLTKIEHNLDHETIQLGDKKGLDVVFGSPFFVGE